MNVEALKARKGDDGNLSEISVLSRFQRLTAFLIPPRALPWAITFRANGAFGSLTNIQEGR
jgi:hypothetical protein